MGTWGLFGLIGGIVGASLGVFGGLFGTWCSIRNTDSPREKAFVVRASIACWVFITMFVIGMFLLPNSIRNYLWIPYSIFLIVGILVWNSKQAKIRRQEGSVCSTGKPH